MNVLPGSCWIARQRESGLVGFENVSRGDHHDGQRRHREDQIYERTLFVVNIDGRHLCGHVGEEQLWDMRNQIKRIV